VIPLPELSRRRRLLVLVICSSSLFIVGLDSTIVNIALPSIGRDLHASVAGLQWTVDGYALVLASLLMLSGATADRVGRRRVFQIGLATFTLGSALCSLAPSLGWLVAFRMTQAIGGSMLNPVAMSIITNTFTEKVERARAIGVWSATYGLSMSLGPVVGGLLVDSIGWRGTFYVNIPVGLAAIALTARFVPESRASRPRRPDPVGQALIIVMLGSLTYAIIEGPARGWHAPVIVTLFAVAAASLGAFVAYEARRAEPVLDPRFFRSAPLAGAVLTAISATAAVGGFLFLATLYLQDVRGLSAVRAGLDLLPMATMVALGALVSSRILARRGARLPMVAAGVALAAGGLLLSRLTASSGLVPLFTAFVVFGIGGGVINAPITYTAVSGLPVSQAGVASGIASTSRQIGQVLGIAVAGSILAAGLRGRPLRTGFVTASHPDWLLLAAMGAVIVVLGLVTASRWAVGTAARTAARFETGPGAELVPGDLAQVPEAGDGDVPLAGLDDAASPPVAQGARHRGPGRPGQAG
jgi:EmrB/QacA subfamily drug resistance transporter